MENNEECLLSKDLMEEIGLEPDQARYEINDLYFTEFLNLNFDNCLGFGFEALF